MQISAGNDSSTTFAESLDQRGKYRRHDFAAIGQQFKNIFAADPALLLALSDQVEFVY